MSRNPRTGRVSASGRRLAEQIAARWRREDAATRQGPTAWRRLMAARRVARRTEKADEAGGAE